MSVATLYKVDGTGTVVSVEDVKRILMELATTLIWPDSQQKVIELYVMLCQDDEKAQNLPVIRPNRPFNHEARQIARLGRDQRFRVSCSDCCALYGGCTDVTDHKPCNGTY